MVIGAMVIGTIWWAEPRDDFRRPPQRERVAMASDVMVSEYYGEWVV